MKDPNWDGETFSDKMLMYSVGGFVVIIFLLGLVFVAFVSGKAYVEIQRDLAAPASYVDAGPPPEKE